MRQYLDLTWLDPLGLWLISKIETVIELGMLTAILSALGVLVTIWTMQRTTAGATTLTRAGRILWLQRVALGLLSMSLGLNAITPFVTIRQPWLASLPLSVTVTVVLFVVGLGFRLDTEKVDPPSGRARPR